MSNYGHNNMQNSSAKKSVKIHLEKSMSNRVNGIENGECTKQGLTGYGSQYKNQHPSYRTTSKEYGWYAPDNHTVPSVYYPTQQRFSSYLYAAGMYRNHSLNTRMDSPGYK
ncbi:piercer of microtubule wall 2 protein [Arctopsyche grandis]|uniref:piercer of microtubule wall 2 protein n=1 Tax=Arctopsyche grandis TaxID=121162 RepID=UPI00406D84CB